MYCRRVLVLFVLLVRSITRTSERQRVCALAARRTSHHIFQRLRKLLSFSFVFIVFYRQLAAIQMEWQYTTGLLDTYDVYGIAFCEYSHSNEICWNNLKAFQSSKQIH